MVGTSGFVSRALKGLITVSDELVAGIVGLRREGVARDRPCGVGRQEGEWPAGARAPGIEGGLDSGFVAFLCFSFSGGVVHSGKGKKPQRIRNSWDFMQMFR